MLLIDTLAALRQYILSAGSLNQQRVVVIKNAGIPDSGVSVYFN